MLFWEYIYSIPPATNLGAAPGSTLKAVTMETASSAMDKEGDIDEFGRSNALRERYQDPPSLTPVSCSRARGESASSARCRGSERSPSVGTKRESGGTSECSATSERRAKSPRSMSSTAVYVDEVVNGSATPVMTGDQECPKQEPSATPDSSPSADCEQQAVGRNRQGPQSRDASDLTGGAYCGAGESVSSAHDDDGLTRCCEYGNLFSEADELQCDAEVQVTMPVIVCLLYTSDAADE